MFHEDLTHNDDEMNSINKQKYTSNALYISNDNQKFLEYGALSDQLKETKVTVFS